MEMSAYTGKFAGRFTCKEDPCFKFKGIKLDKLKDVLRA
jgi:hypothetical protein